MKFCSAALAIYNSDPVAFVQFALNGVYNSVQVVVDPILNAFKVEETYHEQRDYDSLLGIAKDIQVTTALSVYPVSRTEDVLSKNIHLHYNFQNSKVSATHSSLIHLG
jgi:hypothetical protein